MPDDFELPKESWWEKLRYWWHRKWAKHKCDGCEGTFRYYYDGTWVSGDWWLCDECYDKYMEGAL